MVFPFTFSFSVPGLFNPFRTSSSSSSQPAPKISDHSELFKNQFRAHQTPTSEHCHRRSQESGYTDIPAPAYPSSSSSLYPSSTSYPIPIPSATTNRRISRSQLPKIPRRHSPSPSPSSLGALPVSRKRGWEPAFGVDSIQSLTSNGKSSSTTSLTFVSSSGYLDTPAKYREMAEDITMSDSHYRENEIQHDDDAPPMKKRRGLAGSIVSTAVSAALIGTAVGLTVYRLWRDRGKEAQIANGPAHAGSQQDSDNDHDKQIPPPPYDAGHWRAVDQPAGPAPNSQQQQQQQQQARAIPITPGTPRSKAAGVGKRVVGGTKKVSARRTRHYNHTHTPKRGFGSSPSARREFDFGRGEGGEVEEEGQMGREARQTEVEDKMDWLGDKMALLIEQGRRALQSEVVVMSEAKEDEVDDGRGGWEEEEDGGDDESDFDDDDAVYGRSGAMSRAGSVRSVNTHRQRKSRPRDIVVPSPTHAQGKAKVGLGLYGGGGVHTTTTPAFVPAPSSYPSGSLSSSPRRSGFVGLSSSLTSAYATPSTSYTHTHASAGFVSNAHLNFSSSAFNTPPPADQARGHGHVRGMSYESALPSFAGAGAGAGEEQAGWESPEIREGMERARARMLARRNGMSGV